MPSERVGEDAPELVQDPCERYDKERAAETDRDPSWLPKPDISLLSNSVKKYIYKC